MSEEFSGPSRTGILTVPTSRSNVLVAGAGTAAADNSLLWAGILNSKDSYSLDGETVQAGVPCAYWNGSAWLISMEYDADSYYTSSDDTAIWDATFSLGDTGIAPAPTVTEVLTGRRALTGLALGTQVKDLDTDFVYTLLVVGGEATEANWKVGPKELVLMFNWTTFVRPNSGLLTIGNVYEIQFFNAGDDFINCGAASNDVGVVFTATGTTPTNWTHSSTLLDATASFATPPAVLSNTLGGVPVWSWAADGTWYGVLAGAFPVLQTVPSYPTPNEDVQGSVNVYAFDDDTLRIYASLDGSPANELLAQLPVTIKVYPVP